MGPEAAQITSNSAVISWSTNRAASSQVEYGTTAALGSASAVGPSGTSHSVPLGKLPAGDTIYFRVRSVDADGEVAQSGTLSFQRWTRSHLRYQSPPVSQARCRSSHPSSRSRLCGSRWAA